MTTTNNFDSEQFLIFVQTKKSNTSCGLKKLGWLDSKSNQQNDSIQEQFQLKKEQTAAHHRRVTNNGKGLIRFGPNGNIVTQDERLRIAIYQSTYRDVN